jgi:hypothetical protein
MSTNYLQQKSLVKRFVWIFFIFVSFWCIASVYADEPVLPKISALKPGDKVYLDIAIDSQFSLYLVRGQKSELLDPDKEGYFLIPYDGSIVLRIALKEWFSAKGVRDVNTKELLDTLRQWVNANPTDKTKWTVRYSTVPFTFVGVQRLFYLKSIRTPNYSSHRKHAQYSNGHAPGLRLRVDRNGEYQGYIQSKNKAWNTEFPRDKNNRIEIREGSNDTLTFRLRDWNTTLNEHPITEFWDITYKDLIGGAISEKLDSVTDLKDHAITLEFRPIEP